MFICICNPVIENGNFLGLLRVLVSLEKINDLVDAARFGKKGYAWIITEQGIMLAHPKPEHRGTDIMAIRKKAFPDFGWSELEGIVNRMKYGEEGIGTYQSAWWTEEKLKIVRKLTAFSPINIREGRELWSIGVSLSYDEIAGPIKRNALNNFIGAGSLLLVFSIGGIILYRTQRKSAEMEIIARSAAEQRVLNEKLQSEIIERKKSEEIAYKYDHRFARMLEVAEDAVVSMDEKQRIIIFNKGAERVFGYTADEIIGKSIEVLIPERFRLNHSVNVKNYGKSEMNSLRLNSRHSELFGIRKNGEEFRAEISISKFIEDDKWIFTAIVSDITNRIEMEAEAAKAQKLESVGILAGGIAHDFNNILTAIMGNTQLAMMLSTGNDKVYDRLKTVEMASIRAKDLTQQLLTFSKGGRPVKNTASIIELVKDSTKFALTGSNIKAKYDFAVNLWYVDIDVGQINQVVNNIVINAQQAMPDGGVLEVSAKNITEDESKDITFLKYKRYVQISIEDSGIGVSPDALKKIFDPYYTTKQKGSGLGLASSYSIIKNHGGHITATSELNVGTTFNIFLAASLNMPVKNEDERNQPIVGNGRILVMDDDEMVSDFANKMLTIVGYNVECAKDGNEAIETYLKRKEEGNPFDVVLMDLTVPGDMGGKEAIKKLHEIEPEAKAVVYSGYSNDPVLANFKQYGFKGVVTKPFEIRDMNEVLQKAING